MREKKKKLDFEKAGGLIPAIIQHAATGQVLMLGFMDEQALARTRAEGRVVFYSRSKRRLWVKGETSGNFLDVKEIVADCDNDTLLIRALPSGPTCHTGSDTCFGEKYAPAPSFLPELERIVRDRKARLPEKSYTSGLFKAGLNRIAQKVGEEAVETVIAAKDNDLDALKSEAADLVYHLIVLLREKGLSLAEVDETLRKRHGRKR